MGRDIRTLVINFSKNLATEHPTKGKENHLPTRSEYRGAWRVVSWWPWWLSWVGAWAARHLCHRLLFHRCPRAVAAVAAVIACEVVVRRDFLVQGDQESVISGLVASVSSASCPRLYQGLLVTLMRLLSGVLLGMGDIPPWLLLLVSALAGLLLHFVSGKGHVAVLQRHLQVSSEHLAGGERGKGLRVCRMHNPTDRKVCSRRRRQRLRSGPHKED